LIDGMDPPAGDALEAIGRDIWWRCYDRDRGDPLLEEVVELTRQIGTQ
jgi:hypothetical protein